MEACRGCKHEYLERHKWTLYYVDYLRDNNGIYDEMTSIVCDKCNTTYEPCRQRTRFHSSSECYAHSLFQLKGVLQRIVENDTNYSVRDGLLFEAMKLARAAGFQTSIYIDDKEGPNWPCFAIVLPQVGQVSWHMKNEIVQYDGHTTEEKLKRCLQFAKQ